MGTPRLQMSRAEAESSREAFIRDEWDLACWVGAKSESIEDLREGIRARFGASLHAKVAVLPREEWWSIRFLRAPGGWLTTGQRLHPSPGPRMPGSKLPTYVRLRVPITKTGMVPRSMAPRSCDLPALVPGSWKNVRLHRRYFPPTLEVLVDAPVYGITVVPVSVDTDPLNIEFPIKKTKLLAEFRALEKRRAEAKSEKLKEDYINGYRQPTAPAEARPTPHRQP